MVNRKEASSTVVKRCLALLHCLQRGPATKQQLIQAVLEDVDAEAYGQATGRALDRRFEADKQKLCDLFALDLRYCRATGAYKIAVIREPLLDLPDEALSTIAFLQGTFEPGAPKYDAVQALLGRLGSYLAPKRQGVLEHQRQTLEVSWGQRDDDEIVPQVDEKLRKALLEHRLITFDYDSPASADGKPRQHVVEPWECFFDSGRGHYYLYGYCREVREPDGSSTSPRKYIYYRLGRIAHVEVLPDKLPPYPPHVPQTPLVYRLAPEIARRGDVSRHRGITIERTEAQPDGAILVHATTDNLWWAVRTLLHYGATCEILGGPEALAEIRQIVRALADLYTLRENSE